jgi:hypothetical protein
MHTLTARDLLRVWEWGEALHPVDRALGLLAIACPEKTHDELAALSIGQRDALLLSLRELTLGPRLGSFARCPECGERLEFSLDVADLRAADAGEPVETEQTITAEEYEVHFRLPNSLDLAAVARCDDVGIARNLLVQRCVLQARRGAKEVAADTLSEAVIAALAAQMAACDPLSEMQLDLCCTECGHRWPAILDIVSFFWEELSARVKRLLDEIHVLARAYGWREPDILALSDRRRRLYLEMVI